MNRPEQDQATLRHVMRARDYFTLAFGSIVGVFPKGVSFAAGWAMTFANAIVCPFEAVAMGRVAAHLFPQMNSLELYQVAGYPVYLPHLLLGLATTAIIIWVNYRGIRHSTLLQNVTTYGLLAVFVLFSVLGFSRGHLDNLPPYFADENGISGAMLSVLAALQIVPYYMMGFETIPKCSEEAARDFEARRFLPVMFCALEVVKEKPTQYLQEVERWKAKRRDRVTETA